MREMERGMEGSRSCSSLLSSILFPFLPSAYSALSAVRWFEVGYIARFEKMRGSE
jgi:hypothetical protein